MPLVLDTETNQTIDLPADKIAAGGSRYSAIQPGGEVTSGGTVARTPEERNLLEQNGQANFDSGSSQALQEREAAHQQALKSWDNRMQAFSEGAIDALSVGLVHATDTHDQEVSEANPGFHFVGEALGTAGSIAIPGGPGAKLTEGAKGVGKALASTLIKSTESRLAQGATRAIEEAAIGAALGTTHALGSGITESIIHDKPLTAEAVASEAGLGTLMGFAFGGIGGLMEKSAITATKGPVIAQDGLLSSTSKEAKALVGLANQAHRELDSALASHQVKLGALQAFEKEGVLEPVEITKLRVQEEIISDAVKAQKKLAKFDAGAINGKDSEFAKWRSASEDYQASMRRFDEANGPVGSSLTPHEGDTAVIPGPVDTQGGYGEDSASRDANMAMGLEARGPVIKNGREYPARAAVSSDQLASDYERIYGQKFEPGRYDQAAPGEGRRMPIIDQESLHAPMVGEENLGGKVTPNSDNGTNPGKGRRASTEVLGPSKSEIPRPEELSDSIHPELGQRIGVDRIGQSEYGTKQNPFAKAEAKANYKESVELDKTVPGVKPEVDNAKTIPSGEPSAVTEVKADARNQARVEVRRIMNDWAAESAKSVHQSPTKLAEMQISNLLNKLDRDTGGRLDMSAGVWGDQGHGFSMTDRIAQVRDLRSMAEMAAAEARGVDRKSVV